MAGPSRSKQGTAKNPKSPKRKRNNKTTAAETGSFEVDNEDYNIRSLERTQLLTQIKGILNNSTVTPVFWAGCQLADMNCLQELATTGRKIILYSMKPLNFLPLQCELQEFWPNRDGILTVNMLTVKKGISNSEIRKSQDQKKPQDVQRVQRSVN
jgi:hypothetical protein